MTRTRKPAPGAGSELELTDERICPWDGSRCRWWQCSDDRCMYTVSSDHLARGRAEFQRVLDESGDTLSAVLAWIRTSFDEQARADMLRERDERNDARTQTQAR